MGVTTKWRSGVATDPGRVRDENEDRFYVDDDLGIFLVVDGVGGHAAGETAAEIAVEVIRTRLSASRQEISQAIAAANNEIYQHACADESLQGMPAC